MRSSLQQAMRAQQAVQNMHLARHDHATRQHASAAFRADGAQQAEKVSDIASRFRRNLQSDATTEEAEGGVIDLGHFMDDTPYLTRPNTPVFRVHKMFTLLGLRHLPVVDQGERVVGMITRKDLLPWLLDDGAAHKAHAALEEGRGAQQDLHEQALEVRIAKLRLAVHARDAEIQRLQRTGAAASAQELVA